MSKLYRSRKNKKISGLCGGLAQWLGFDATIIRLAVVIAAFCSFGAVVAIYLIASLIVPDEPISWYDIDDSYSSKY
ncbi:PspC domain-containing protein [Paenibacillus physcomitrellae]|uniref:PspC domain-containing protein n=1 Tax=Paenibacillus physcomitrellae TaxID=1619311 RepID=UPI000B8CE3D6|nr:PspC domain-containing protein [Paenibacillus physcomitrellae]